MDDYISRNAVQALICENCNISYLCDGEECKRWSGGLAKIPAADIHPVVFCKDCFFYRKDKELAEAAYLNPEEYCALLRVEMGEKSFCSYGRKLEKEEEK